jgi:hypothetical protein
LLSLTSDAERTIGGDSAYDKVPRKKRSRPLPHAGPSKAMTAAKELRLAQERAARPPSVMPTAPENESAEAKRDRVNARRRERHQELKDAAAVNSARSFPLHHTSSH